MPLTQVLRSDLYKALAGNEPAIRAIEKLFRDLENAPEGVAGAQEAADAAQETADSASTAAGDAQGTANSATTAAGAAQSTANAVAFGLSNHIADTTTHGTVGDIVGTSDTQILSGKTLDGPTPFTSRTLATGATAAVLTANKPGASTAVATWVTVSFNGTNYVLPLWLPT